MIEDFNKLFFEGCQLEPQTTVDLRDIETPIEIKANKQKYTLIPAYDTRIYCRYIVIDLQTGYELIIGEKWKAITDDMEYDGWFYSGLFRRKKIYIFKRETTVNGRKCLIVYWLNADIRKTYGSVVHLSGLLAGLKGNFYSIERSPCNMKRFLKSLGYTR